MIRLDKTEKWLVRGVILGLMMVAAGWLVGCKSTGEMDMSWLPASQDYAAQVAADNAAHAATNPLSFWLTAGGAILSSLLGAVGLARRAVKQFDAMPFEAEDGSKMSEEELVAIAKQAKASPSIPDVKGLD